MTDSADETGPPDRKHSGHEQQEHGPLRSFGRRRSRKLSPRQSGLLADRLSAMSLPLSAPPPQPLTELFEAPVRDAPIRDVWLEIGFGGGEHLLWQARQNPQSGIIGCEPFIDGVVKVLDGASVGKLANIRVHADDARDVLPWLPPASISRAFVLFPDPWPKKRHIKRRLVQPEFIRDLARVMPPGAELRLASDIPDYVRGMLAAVRQDGFFRWTARNPSDWRERPSDWPATRYEQKARREGRRCYFLRFVKKD